MEDRSPPTDLVLHIVASRIPVTDNNYLFPSHYEDFCAGTTVEDHRSPKTASGPGLDVNRVYNFGLKPALAGLGTGDRVPQWLDEACSNNLTKYQHGSFVQDDATVVALKLNAKKRVGALLPVKALRRVFVSVPEEAYKTHGPTRILHDLIKDAIHRSELMAKQGFLRHYDEPAVQVCCVDPQRVALIAHLGLECLSVLLASSTTYYTMVYLGGAEMSVTTMRVINVQVGKATSRPVSSICNKPIYAQTCWLGEHSYARAIERHMIAHSAPTTAVTSVMTALKDLKHSLGKAVFDAGGTQLEGAQCTLATEQSPMLTANRLLTTDGLATFENARFEYLKRCMIEVNTALHKEATATCRFIEHTLVVYGDGSTVFADRARLQACLPAEIREDRIMFPEFECNV
ncbi:hypothetical protein LTR97_012211 [Elasticomyces elasticus]|uniref:Uncharacterized protein n=1 Tax=Elasticomyces elasticus TaxID=574655 RepID=A0AAN7VXP5_9PEZI|nr:hypothetical protein LTR97_012211 [Elasticomyces elasticus]